MDRREELQALLESLLGSKQVYYQPPENIKMSYPAIVYFKSRIDTKKANDKTYQKRPRYEVTVIGRRPDHAVIQKILDLPYASYDRHYVADNLHHDVLTLY